VAYFSDVETDCPDGDPCFNCFHFTIDKSGSCSNHLNRHIIKENVKHLLQESEYLNTSTHNSKVYVFGLHDITKSENQADITCACPHGVPLFSLSEYISTLYFSPLLGRKLFIEGNRQTFINISLKFKEDRKKGLIQEVDTSLEENVFSKICLYRILKPLYATNFVYIYHQNRLIYTISSREKLICGYIEIP
jgi:hypothetical protein